MAFSLANPGGSTFGTSAFGGNAGGASDVQTRTGPELEEIQTQSIEFQGFDGESKVRLLASPWPSDALPPPTSSLLSIASNKGMLAAAGPDSVVIASTDAVREAFTAKLANGGNIKPFSPQLTLTIGTRISQVAFSADESCLVISAETGGGLAVYDVDTLMQGKTQSAFEMATNGTSIRALIPNPNPEKAELFAIVTVNGDLMIANMKNRNFLAGPNGQVIKNGVSCVSWSNKGVQLVAGLGSGNAFLTTPEGEGKGEIPRPPGLDGDHHISAISWLGNHLFLVAHTPTTFEQGMAPTTTYHLITRNMSPLSYLYQKAPEICGPWGLNRSPPFQFVQRLRRFPPNIEEIVILASTASEDVGLYTKASAPLTGDIPAERITNVFTATGMLNDSRRAQLPMTEDLSSSTSPIGMVLDLSSKSSVSRPIPGDEIELSPGPLPGLLILNNEGVLAGWWVVYADAIRQGQSYPGLAINGNRQQTEAKAAPMASPFSNAAQPSTSSFGQSAFSQPSGPAFGVSSAQGTAPGLFGAASSLGNRQSPWGASTSTPSLGGAVFGQPAFGASTAFGSTATPSFGSPGGIGVKPSLWGTPTSAAAVAPANHVFGQGQTATAAFGTSPAISVASGGFSSFANIGGFGSVANAGGSVLKQPTPAPSSDSAMDTASIFGATLKKEENAAGRVLGDASAFGGTDANKDEKPADGLFGSGASFSLQSGWKNDHPEPPTNIKVANGSAGSFFGDTFGTALEDASDAAVAQSTEEADMILEAGDAEPKVRPASPADPASMTPVDTPAPARFFTATPATEDLLGTQAQSSTTTPVAVQTSVPAPPLTENTPQPSISKSSGPMIKEEPSDERSNVDNSVLEAPLAPEPRSKTSFTPGTSSNSSTAASKTPADDVPLPPDFVKTRPKLTSVPSLEDALLPPNFAKISQKPAPAAPSKKSSEEEQALPDGGDDDDLDDEGSGVDVAQEITPTEPSPRITPESSFGGSKYDKSPGESVFSSIGKAQPKPLNSSLFGDMERTPTLPFLPPPTAKPQGCPRSPSPTRAVATHVFRPDNSRSTSAPGVIKGIGANRRKSTLGRPSQSVVPQIPSSAVSQRRQDERDRFALQIAKQQAEEEQDLSDREDERVREELSTEVEATLSLGPFIAHQDYVGNITKTGIPGQIETVYRDINSMIDTLGLNSRTLQGFIKGHTECFKEAGRDREDLRADGDWCLEEIEDLAAVEGALEGELKHGRLNDVPDKIDSCQRLNQDLAKLRAKTRDIKRLIEARTDPDQVEASRAAPLSSEQSAMRQELRKRFSGFQKSLADAEEGISMLRAKLASHSATSRQSKGGQKVPTVEAIERTIMKMTSMAEKKSGDIDVLEKQMRRLNMVGGSQCSGEDPPFVTPPTSARKKGAGELAEEDVARLRARAERRRKVNGLLKEALVRRGIKVRTLDDV